MTLQVRSKIILGIVASSILGILVCVMFLILSVINAANQGRDSFIKNNRRILATQDVLNLATQLDVMRSTSGWICVHGVFE
jgi:hypothetical protein